MMNIVIDPLIVMTPSDSASRESVAAWFDNLSTWLNEALTAPFTWLHYLQASNLLQEHGQFPGFEELKRLQRQYRLDINIRPLAQHINEFFRNEELDLEMHIKRLDFIVEPASDSILVQPAQFIARLPDYLRRDFFLLLAHCCVCKHISLPLGQKLHIATLELPDNARAVSISMVILSAVPESICNDGDTITQTFPLLITPDDLPASNDIIDIWSQGEASIVYTLQQLLKKEATTASIHPFAFAWGFISSNLLMSVVWIPTKSSYALSCVLLFTYFSIESKM